jgi:hypothetical protein
MIILSILFTLNPLTAVVSNDVQVQEFEVRDELKQDHQKLEANLKSTKLSFYVLSSANVQFWEIFSIILSSQILIVIL